MQADIVLVHMPFGPLGWPSAGLGVLAAALKNGGTACRTTYPAFRFAEQIGHGLYSFISRSFGADTLLHDWLFSAHVMPAAETDLAVYVEELNRIIDNSGSGKLAHAPLIRQAVANNLDLARFFDHDGSLCAEPLIALRQAAASFVTRTAEAILAGKPKMVGCTTTFLQFNASVSLAKELKRLDPSVITVLGGAGVEAEMGYQAMRRFPFIDLVFSGEADTLFPTVCADLLADADLAAIAERYPAGLLARPYIDSPHDRSAAAERWRTPLVANLDDLPIPDYGDYFAELADSGLAHTITPQLPAESSRGCWKGAAQHCAFCGLQGGRMAYRRKSPQRLVDELDELHRRHGNDVFLMSDTIIPMGYFKTVLPALTQEERPFSLFYETPPKLTEEQVRQLADAKVRWIQPGIESLDDRLLQLMNKGNRAIRNIEMLKYCVEQRINARWNLLCDIPGEDDDCYRRMERLVPLLFHLPPPLFLPIRFDRFSPYHARSGDYRLSLRPLARNRLVYPFTEEELADFASFFEDGAATPPPRHPIKARLAALAREWQQAKSAASIPPQLIQQAVGAQIEIIDTRPAARALHHRLTGEAAAIYRACRTAMPVEAIIGTLPPDSAMTAAQAVERLEDLREARLVVEIGGEWLALATKPPRKG